MRAIQITEFGGPEVLQVADLPEPTAADGFDLVKVTGAGVNYADTHQTENSYLSTTELPLVPGSEVGRHPDATAGGSPPSSAPAGTPNRRSHPRPELRPARRRHRRPGARADGAGTVPRGTCCARRTHMAAGESVVVHAAAGGVGTLAIQLAKLWGAGRVIGVASSPDKRELAEQLGADATVDGAAERPDAGAARRERRRRGRHRAGDGRRQRVRRQPRRTRAVRPARDLRHGGASTRRQPIDAGRADDRSRAVIGFWLATASGEPGMVHEPMAEMLDLVAAGRLSSRSSARPTRLPTPSGARGSARPPQHRQARPRPDRKLTTAACRTRSTPSSPRCRCARSPTPPRARPASSASSTPTSGSSGSAPRTSPCTTRGSRPATTTTSAASRSGSCTTAPGASLAASSSTRPPRARLVDRAVEVAKVSKPVTGERIELAAGAGHGEQTWVSSYEVDPFTVSEGDRIALLADWSSRLLGADIVRHADAQPQAGPRDQVLRRPRRHRYDAAASADAVPAHRDCGSTSRPAASRRCGRSRRRSAAAGSS